MGAKKKLVARILKSEPLILKSKPLIFCPLKTRPAGAGDQWPFGRISVCLRVPKMRTNKAWTVAAMPGGRRGVGWGLSGGCSQRQVLYACGRVKGAGHFPSEIHARYFEVG